jgi:hypothetical protein
MTIATFAAWLSKTEPSQAIQKYLWVIPTVQTVHILAVAIVLSSVAMVELRLMGWAGTRTTMPQTAQRYVPWVWGALVVLVLSGAILVTGEPERELTNLSFQIKMALLVCAIGLTASFQLNVSRGVKYWTEAPHTASAKFLGLVTLLIWMAIAVAGRWIAYMDLDKVTL